MQDICFMCSVIKFNTEGIEFALTALFLTVVIEQWISSKNHFATISGIVISVVCLILFGSEHFLIPAMLGISMVLCLYKGGIKNE